MTLYTGGCLCGNVRFSIDSEFTNFHLCHCTQCQRTTGSAHASNLFTNPNALKWTAGFDHVQRYDVPDRVLTNAFCGKCGSPLPYQSLSGSSVVVPAGTLDQPPPLSPRQHIFWEERATWFEALADLPRQRGFGP